MKVVMLFKNKSVFRGGPFDTWGVRVFLEIKLFLDSQLKCTTFFRPYQTLSKPNYFFLSSQT